MTKFTYLPDVDVQLYVVSGEGWSIPVKVQYCDVEGVRHVHLLPAVLLGFAQVAVLERLFSVRGGSRLTVGWLLPETELGAIAKKAPGITPEFYYLWDGTKQKFEPKKGEFVKKRRTLPSTKDAEEFIEHVANGSGIDKGTLMFSWLAITQSMPGWMMSGKRVDFGFCKLLALPYRRNWKSIALARFPNFRKALMLRNAKTFLTLAFSAASRVLRMSELTECRQRSQRDLFGWTIETLHDPSWDRLCEEVELDAARRVGSIPYVKRWANKVSYFEESIYEILSEYVAKENAPSCRIIWRRGERSLRFAQAAPTIIGGETIIECDGGSNASVDDFLGIADSSTYLEEKAERLLRMSAVQQKDEDVRLPRGDDDVLGRTDDGGVLVLHASGGEAPREDVLAGELQKEGEVVQ